MKEFLKKIQCLNGFTLKLTAMILMFIDHMGFILFPGKTWLRVIGRLSFPIFAFFVAEGFYHTKSKKKYILRMLIFALITEPVFDIAFYVKINPLHQNVLFTFLMALFGLMVLDFITKKIPDAMASKLLGGLSFAIFALFAEVMRTDYGCFGVMLVYIFYTLRENFWSKHIFSSGLQLIWGAGIQKYSALSTVLLMMYNGRQGPEDEIPVLSFLSVASCSALSGCRININIGVMHHGRKENSDCRNYETMVEFKNSLYGGFSNKFSIHQVRLLDTSLFKMRTRKEINFSGSFFIIGNCVAIFLACILGGFQHELHNC